MATYMIDGATLTGLADALRNVTGETRTYTPAEMIEAVTTILDAATYILRDSEGNEMVGVLVENEVEFDATANDIRAGKIAATAEGVTTGTKEIPAYHTTEGMKVITAGSEFVITGLGRESAYTKLQALICANSLATEKVAVNNKVYAVGSTTVLAEVTVDSESQVINLGITNEATAPYVIRYFTYKEEA
jgi:hypothetical protein